MSKIKEDSIYSIGRKYAFIVVILLLSTDKLFFKGIQWDDSSEITIFDTRGNKVSYWLQNNEYIDINRLESGIYMVKIENEVGQKNYRFVKL